MTVSEKFIEDMKSAKLTKKGSAVSGAVTAALEDFCRQNHEFEQAVLQGGSVADCIESTVKGSGSSISDLEVYRKAVEFYFPTAKVCMTMTLDLGDGGYSGEDKPITMSTNKVELSLDDLLDF
jgi:hypothetical protein